MTGMYVPDEPAAPLVDPAWQARKRGRLMLGIAAFACVFLVLVGRAAQLALTPPQKGVMRARNEAPEIEPVRADIVDRNGEILATTVTMFALSINLREMGEARETARAIASVLPGIDGPALAKRLASARGQVLVKRDLTPRQRQQVHDLGLAGIVFEEENRRVYPRDSLAAHVLGGVNIDGRGIGGVELGLENAIFEAGAQHRPVTLSLDSRVQAAVESEIASAGSQFRALGAVGIVLDAASGELLALASWPTFNPNRPGSAAPNQRQNRAASVPYEMGSTFKAFTYAAGFDLGLINDRSRWDSSQPITADGQVIKEPHPIARPINAREAFAKSSNRAAASVGLAIGEVRLREAIGRFGLLARPEVELQGVAQASTPQSWPDLTVATIAYGHSISVSPLALASAYGVFANRGVRVEPTLLARARDLPVPRTQVIAPETSSAMLNLLRGVVEEGTGKRAGELGYAIAGKTGTGLKFLAGQGYQQDRMVSNFAAVFPADIPRYVALVLLDEPMKSATPDGATGAGATAAPAAGRIIARIAPFLGIDPKRPESDAAAQNALQVAERTDR